MLGKREKSYLSGLVIVFLVVLLLLSIVVAQKGERIEKRDKKVRVLAHSDEEIARAIAEGCQIVREVKKAELAALKCPAESASAAKLPEDIKVFAVDTKANTQIRADLVQNAGNNGGGRKIVVLDSGIDYNHPELSASYLGGKDFVNNDSDPADDNGHGTHVSGIITADGLSARAKGVAPAAGIIAGKVLDESGAGFFSDVIEAIYWAVDGDDGLAGTEDDFNADAISMSLGTGAPYLYRGFCDSVYSAMTDAIKYAKDRGMLVVVAAGNSGGAGVSLPGCISYSTTVGAVNFKDRIASFSGRGKSVDIVAPGVDIYSTYLGGGYATGSGTSMATPMVSGTAALIKAQHPEYTPAQIEDALFKTAKDLGNRGKDNSYGWGRVDAYAAVNFV
jgi:subtilisin family serine protease